MQAVKSKFGIFIALLFCATVIGTCTLVHHPTDTSPHPSQDSTFINQWKKEKVQLQKVYDKQIITLQTQKDSLQNVVSEKKNALTAYRYKAAHLQNELQAALVKADTSHLLPDSLMPIANNYFDTQAQSDSTCNETIRALEQVVGNRDSSIVIYKQVESNLRDLQKEQAMREQNLTDQLNTAYKTQRRKIVQNKFLASGLLLLSGFTTTLLFTQTLK